MAAEGTSQCADESDLLAQILMVSEFLKCELKNNTFAKGRQVMEEHYSQYDTIELLHSGSAFEDLYLPFLHGDAYNVDSDHMIVRKDITVTEKPNLPLEDSNVECYLMVPASHAGYVKLKGLSRETHRPTDANNTSDFGEDFVSSDEFVQRSKERFPPLKPNIKDEASKGIVTGPSLCQHQIDITAGPDVKILEASHGISRDVVYTLRCRDWPSPADQWRTRNRISEWPPQNTMDAIIKAGYHIVPVGHYTSNERSLEWRMSFSLAEQTLILLMSKEQKRAYSILKCLVKSVPSLSVVSSYHIKTTLLWTSEKHAADSWTQSATGVNVIRIIDQLIAFYSEHKLPNYFIPGNNMVDHLDPKILEDASEELCGIRDNLPIYLAELIDKNMTLPCGIDSMRNLLKDGEARFKRGIKYSYLGLAMFSAFHHKCEGTEQPVIVDYYKTAVQLHSNPLSISPCDLENPTPDVILSTLDTILGDDTKLHLLDEREITSIVIGIVHVVAMVCNHTDFMEFEKAMNCLDSIATMNSKYNSGFLDHYHSRKSFRMPSFNAPKFDNPDLHSFTRLAFVVVIGVYIEKTNSMLSILSSAAEKGSRIEANQSFFEIFNVLELGILALRFHKDKAYLLFKLTAFLRGISIKDQLLACEVSLTYQAEYVQSVINLLELILEKDDLKGKITETRRISVLSNLACYYHTAANKAADDDEKDGYLSKARSSFIEVRQSVHNAPPHNLDYALFLIKEDRLGHAAELLERITEQGFNTDHSNAYSKLESVCLDDWLHLAADVADECDTRLSAPTCVLAIYFLIQLRYKEMGFADVELIEQLNCICDDVTNTSKGGSLNVLAFAYVSLGMGADAIQTFEKMSECKKYSAQAELSINRYCTKL